MFIASLVVSLVVPLPLRVCLAFACVMFNCLPCVLVVSYCLRVCIAFSIVEERRGRVGSCVSGHSNGVMMESSVSVLQAGL